MIRAAFDRWFAWTVVMARNDMKYPRILAELDVGIY
jgi:hypothetical protein